MKPSKLLIIGGIICIALIILLLLRPHSNRETSRNHSGSANPPQSAAAAPAGNHGKSHSSRTLGDIKHRPIGRTVSELHDLGFTITADRIGESSGEGNVILLDPNGFKFTGQDFTISEDGKDIILTGQVTMEMRTTTHTKTNTSVAKDAIVRIAVDGTTISLPGPSTVKNVPHESEASINQ